MPAKKVSASNGAAPYPKRLLHEFGPQRSFTGQTLDQIAFPLGGLGVGSINLGGSGNLIDFSIFNRPNLGGQPLAFATITEQKSGAPDAARVLEGPVTCSRIYAGGRYANGANVGHEGFPRMESAVFRGEFPYAWIEFREPDLDLAASLEAFSPFIPLDDFNSSIPAAILRYRFVNRSRRRIRATFAFHLSHMISAPGDRGAAGCLVQARSSAPARGLVYSNSEIPDNHPRAATFALATPDRKPVLKAGWFRGGWFDARTMLWREIESGRFAPSRQSPPIAEAMRRALAGGSVAIPFDLGPGERRECAVVLAWHTPRCDVSFGWPKESGGPSSEGPSPCCVPADDQAGACADPRVWRPYHAAKWKDAWSVAQYVCQNLTTLEQRTRRFHDLFFSTTAPSYVLDAVSANLGILKSPTCLRLEDGTLWAFEGCRPNAGCCAGCCTHVWNYAQAIPHLFPPLERTLRHLEMECSMNDEGHVKFRAPLPPTVEPEHEFHAAADGQLGGIMKLYRDWQIAGDDTWLRRMLPLAVRSLEYCIRTWDPDRQGALFEGHHNTYDIEFYGPDGMCASVYLGALRAMAEMAEHTGDAEYAAQLRDLAGRGARYCDRELFNGQYYFQKIMAKGLRRDFLQAQRADTYTPEALAIARREGPKYQYGTGCLSDGVIGQWFATLYGSPDALDRRKTRQTLRSIFRYNFKPSLRRHANPQRATYALNDEPGLLLCTWPKGGKPALPFVYSDEVWTGIEYQVASHLIYEGLVDEGLTIVRAVRSRYDGARRNPWNEYECGSYYARALSSYALLTALTGFRYSAVRHEAVFDPRLENEEIACFFSTAHGWGRFVLHREKKATSIRFEIEEGRLPLRAVRLPLPQGAKGQWRASVEGAHIETTVQTKDGFALVRLASPIVARPGEPATIQVRRQ